MIFDLLLLQFYRKLLNRNVSRTSRCATTFVRVSSPDKIQRCYQTLWLGVFSHLFYPPLQAYWLICTTKNWCQHTSGLYLSRGIARFSPHCWHTIFNSLERERESVCAQVKGHSAGRVHFFVYLLSLISLNTTHKAMSILELLRKQSARSKQITNPLNLDQIAEHKSKQPCRLLT